MIKATPILVFIFLIATLGSCKTTPVACFTITTPADSIRVGHVVIFDAGCSSDATSYYWDFGNGQSSISSPTAQFTYDSAAPYSVTLIVGNYGKSASLSRSIVVLP